MMLHYTIIDLDRLDESHLNGVLFAIKKRPSERCTTMKRAVHARFVHSASSLAWRVHSASFLGQQDCLLVNERVKCRLQRGVTWCNIL